MSRRVVFLLLLAVTAIVGGGLLLSRPWSDPAEASEKAAIVPPPVVTAVVALGILEPVSGIVRIDAPSGSDAGRLSRNLVAEGDWVEAGQTLAVLDTQARLKARLVEAQAAVDQSQAALEKAIADLDHDARVGLADVQQRQAQRDQAAWDYEKLKRLQQAGNYQDSVLVEKTLALRSAEAALSRAQSDLHRRLQQDESGQRLDELERRAQLAAAQATLAVAQEDLAFAQVRASFAGRILKVLARPGESADRDGLFELADTRLMRVRAEVFEADAAMLQVGVRAKILSRALETPLDGAVEQIGFKVNKQSIVTDDADARQDARVVEVLVRLDAEASRRVANFSNLQVRVTFETAGQS
jgi:HlyD family secretion protein